MDKRRVHYVLSTHWDREWHEPFQRFRHRLVKLLDQILAGLADGRLQGPFTTDGQAIIIEDYLEVRPERREEIAAHARAGRLVIGPWYVLPDEWLISGESMIRNLRLGRRFARELGAEPSSAGFVCDLFGHHSQVPQILAGFGIPYAFIWRGLNTIEHRNVIWRGADGTELPCYRFGRTGYCDYAADVRHAHTPEHRVDPAEVERDLDQWLANEAAHTEVEPLLMFDGGDHLEWDPDNYAALLTLMERPDSPFRVVHSSLDAYGRELAAQRERITTVVSGELRESATLPTSLDNQWLIPGVLSSRVPLKQANAECQTLLCAWAEPFSAYAYRLLGDPVPEGELHVAWKWLLQNHPHDSICGCSVDQVHQDMAYRFSQCRQIADQLAEEATTRLAANVAGEVGDDTLRVVVFNPLPQPLDEVVELTLPLPTEWPCFNEFFGFEPKPGFRVYGGDGQEISYQRLAQAMGRIKKRLRPRCFPRAHRTHDVTVALRLQAPALGYTTLTVKRAAPGEPTRHPITPGLADSERSLANEHLRVSVEPNGTLTLEDRRTGRTYYRLLTFESIADIGDGWYHGQAVNDQAFVSTAAFADVALVHDGPQTATLRVRTTMRVPVEFAFDRMARAETLTELVFDSRVTLRAGAARVDVTTTVTNTAGDHRVRVLFPTGVNASTYLVDSAFDVVERPIALPPDHHTYRELEVETRPQQTWTAVCDDGSGLAVVSVGLMESAVRDLPERPIALTLYRSTRRTVMTDGEPDGQLLGQRLVFRYAIVPLGGRPDRAGLCALGQQLAAGLRAVPLAAEDVAIWGSGVGLPAEASLLSIEGPVVMTSCRQVEAALEVRVFNPNEEEVEAVLRPSGLSVSEAAPVDFESNPCGAPLPLTAGAVSLQLAPKAIRTVRLT